MIHGPGRGNIIPCQRNGNDYKTLEPHSYINEDGNDEGGNQACADFFEPEKLGCNYVARHHAPVRPPIRAGSAVDECIRFILYSAIPCYKEFSDVCNTNNRAGEDNNLVHRLDMLNGNI